MNGLSLNSNIEQSVSFRQVPEKISTSDTLQRQPKQDTFNKQKTLTYSLLGTTVAALVGIGLDYKFAEGKHVKNIWNKITGKKPTPKPEQKPDVPKKPSEPAPPTEVKTEPEPMKMNEGAREEYEKIKSHCDGRITTSVRDEKNETLQAMAKLYEKEERNAQLLQEFEAEMKSKSTPELLKEKEIHWRANKKNVDLALTRHHKLNPANSNLITNEDFAYAYLTGEELVEFEFLQGKQDIIEKIIQKRNNVIKQLQHEGDVAIEGPYLQKYAETDAELNAFGMYFDGYTNNSSLRDGGVVDWSQVHLMDGVFERAPELKKESVVYRALYGDEMCKESNEFIDSLKEGMTFTDKAFMSTSEKVDSPQFLQFARSVVHDDYGALMRIRLPKGTKGVRFGCDEFLLPRGSEIKINKVEIVGGMKIVDCEYVLPKK